MCGICLLFLGGVTGYCCFAVIRPFEKLSHFAEEIAAGNFDLPLDYERSNYFGKFTWGFDRMRREIRNARECELEAIENNKTVIAALSHDIKTPVASVRAYAEALDLGMAQTPEQQAEYLNRMMQKCDDITKLTDDMLLHALSDLGSLRMQPEEFDLSALTAQTVGALSAGRSEAVSYAAGKPTARRPAGSSISSRRLKNTNREYVLTFCGERRLTSTTSAPLSDAKTPAEPAS